MRINIIKFIKIIPLFYLSCSIEGLITVGLWEKSITEKIIIGIPLLFSIINLMFLIELLFTLPFAKKFSSASLTRRVKKKCFLNLINYKIVFFRIEKNGLSFIARKFVLNDDPNYGIKIRVFKSLVSERYYVADYVLLLLVTIRILILNLIMFSILNI